MLLRREGELRAALMQCLLFQDEECLRPGEATDLSFLEKLEEKVGDHAHFVTYAFTLCILSQTLPIPNPWQGWGGSNLCLVPGGIKQPIQCLMLENPTGGCGVLGGESRALMLSWSLPFHTKIRDSWGLAQHFSPGRFSGFDHRCL